jgi:hypothetical protein
MSKSEEVVRIRATLAQGRKGKRGRYSTSAREAAIAWAMRQHACGATQRWLSEALGVNTKTISVWLQGNAMASPSSFRRVTVASAASAAAAALVFVTRSGHRVEGLTVETAAALIQATG